MINTKIWMNIMNVFIWEMVKDAMAPDFCTSNPKEEPNVEDNFFWYARGNR